MNGNEPPAPHTEMQFETFGAWVKARRNALNWSQAKLAGRAYCSIDTVRAIEQERANYTPSQEMAERLAACMEIPPAERAAFVALARAPRGNAVHSPAENVTPFVSNTLSEMPAPPSVAPAHALILTKPLIWLLGGLFLICALVSALGMGIPFGIFTLRPLVMQAQPASGQTSFILLTMTEPRVHVEANGITVNDGDTIPRGAQVTVSFEIVNTGSGRARLDTLEIGARGPCAARCDWNAAPVQFAPQKNILLAPQETVTYRASRVFTAPGNYFVEPVMRDVTGRYGGIRPFTRIEFSVAE